MSFRLEIPDVNKEILRTYLNLNQRRLNVPAVQFNIQ